MMHSSLRRPGMATLATMALSQMTDLLEAEFLSPGPSFRRK